MVKFYNWVGLSLLLILSCGNPINLGGPKYSDVIVTEARFDDQLIVKGNRFKDILAVALRDPNTGQIIKRFKVMRYDDHTIIGEQLDYNKIPIPNILDMLIDTAQGQSVIPVQFTISPNSVYTGAIQNGAITPTKFIGVTSPNPQDQSVLTWDGPNQQFIFSTFGGGGGGGGGGDVTGISYGTGIVGDGNTATGTVPIRVNIGTTGSPNPPEKVIPYFNDQKQLVLNSTLNTNTQLLFISGTEQISLSNQAGLFKIVNETIALPAPERDLLTIDAINARVTIQDELYVGSQTVCLADGSGCPTGIVPLTGVSPIVVTGSVVSAKTGTSPGELVILDDGTSTPTGPGFLPGVDGSHLRNIVTKINALDGITVSNGGIGIVDIGLAPAGATGSAQPWSPALTDISAIPYAPVDGEMIIGASGTYVGQSGATLRKSIGLEIGVDVQPFNPNLDQISNATPTAAGQFLLSSNPGQWAIANNPNCGPSGHLMAGDGTSFNCSGNNFTFKLKEIQFFETSNPFTNYVGFVAPADVIVDTIWTLPAKDGLPGTVLTTDGAGKLDWKTGNGDVRGPAASVDRSVAIFQGTTGKVITDSNILIDNLVSRSATPVATGNLPSYAGPTGNLIQDSGKFAANVVTSSLGGTAQNLATFTGGKDIQDSFIPAAEVVRMPGPVGTGDYVLKSTIGVKTATESNILIGNVPTMAVNATGTYQPILSVANGSKALVNASYSIPLGVCPNGEILKSNGVNFVCGTDVDTNPPVISVFNRTGAVVAVAGDYGADQVISTPTGFISANNVQAAINELDTEKLALAGGTMTGQLITSSQNAIFIGKAGGISGELKFEEATGLQYVGFKSPATVATNVMWTLPDVIGTNGQVLTTVGGGVLQWTSVGSAGVGDVIGPSSSSDNAIARFNLATGKIIKNSSVILDDSGNLTGVTSINGNTSSNFVTLIATPTGPNFVYLSNGADKVAKTTSYTFPTTCGPNQILKADNTGFILTCVNDTSGVTSFNGRFGAVIPASNDYTASIVAYTPTGAIAASTTQGAINELEAEKLALAGGTMTGTLITANQNAIQIGPSGANTGELHFLETGVGGDYVGFKSPATLGGNYLWTLPSTLGTNNQILSTNGSGDLLWTTITGGAGGIGDVVGPASSTPTNLASFSNGTGKLIQDSGISSNNLVTMTGTALSAGNILISQGLNKVAIDSFVNIGPGNNVTNLGTLNARVIANWVDGPSPATATDMALARFDQNSGRLIQNSTAILDDGGALSGITTINGKTALDFVTMVAPASTAGQVMLSETPGKAAMVAPYTFPIITGTTGQVLKLISPTSAIWQTVGGGDVTGPATSGSDTVAVFADGTGKLLKSVTLSYLNIVTAPTGDFTGAYKVALTGGAAGKTIVEAPYTFPNAIGTANQILKTNGAGLVTWQDDTAPSTNTVVNMGTSADNAIARFDSTTGKIIQNSTVILDDSGDLTGVRNINGNPAANLVTLVATPTTDDRIFLSNSGSKTAKTSPFTIPPIVCPIGQVLKSDGANYTCSNVGSGDVIGPATSVAGRPATYLDAFGKALANTVPYTIPTLTGSNGQVLTTDGAGATSWVTITQGDVVGPGSSAIDQVALFSGTNGKTIKASPYTLPAGNGAPGQALTTNGVGVASWSPVGNVIQTTGSTTGNIPAYVDGTGKSLVDSNVVAANIVQMPNAATFVGALLMSNGPGKQAQPSPYKFPTDTLGSAGKVLTSNGLDVIWANAAGDVVGPATSGSDTVAVFADGTGKLLKSVTLSYLNIVTKPLDFSAANKVALSAGSGSKALAETTYTFPIGNGTAGYVLKTDGAGAVTWQPDATPSTNTVVNLGTSTDNAIPRFVLASGKEIENSLLTIGNNGELAGVLSINGRTAADFVTLVATPTAADYVYLSNNADRTAKITNYTMPALKCPDGNILKFTSGNLACTVDTSGVTMFNGRTGVVTPTTGDYTAAQVNSTPTVNIAATNVQAAINELDTEKLALTGGTMTGTLIIGSAVQPVLQIGNAGGAAGEIRYLEPGGGDYVGFKAPAGLATNTIWALPLADGASSTVLTTNGAAQLSWSSPSAAGFGDVTGPVSSTDNAIARFDLASGKVIQNSVVTISDGGDLSGVATFTSTGNFSVAGSGSFAGDLSARSYSNNSDKILKKDIKPFTGASSIVDKLMPVTFRWKNNDEKQVIGLIAQDMEKVIPEVISKSNQKGNTIRSYDLGQVLILTLEALKETREELKQTRNELKVLRDKVKDLEKSKL